MEGQEAVGGAKAVANSLMKDSEKVQQGIANVGKAAAKAPAKAITNKVKAKFGNKIKSKMKEIARKVATKVKQAAISAVGAVAAPFTGGVSATAANKAAQAVGKVDQAREKVEKVKDKAESAGAKQKESSIASSMAKGKATQSLDKLAGKGVGSGMAIVSGALESSNGSISKDR